MDHDDVLEQLELAAVEPGGLERLMAGDTAMAAAVVAHLAGCDDCSEELRRLTRAAPSAAGRRSDDAAGGPSGTDAGLRARARAVP